MTPREEWELEPDGELELPAVVLGCNVTVELGEADREPWLFSFTHQCGGLACLQEPLAGIILPLAWNGAVEAAAEVIRGFDALSADSEHAARAARLPPELASLHLTIGKPYQRAQLEALEAWVSRAFRLPPCARGPEAFVELGACDLLATFGGWRALSLDATRVLLPDGNDGDWPRLLARVQTRWDGVTSLDSPLLSTLEKALGLAGARGPLKAFLLWANSD